MAESYDEDKDLNRFRGLEINGAGLDEVNELQEPTFYKVQERIGSWNKAQGKPPILCLATCNPAQNWVKTVIYKRYIENTLPERWAFIPSKITDNPHIPTEYLEALKELPPIQYARFVEGDWDVMDEVLNPFLYEWIDEKHIDDNATLNPNIPVYVSVDFNINPLCALVIQQTSGGANVVDEIRIDKGSIEAFCDAVRALNIPIGLLRITGDAMGRGGTVQQRDNSSAYTMIKRLLHMNDSQFIIPANPKHENSRVDCNSALRRLDIRVNSKRCKGFVFDAKQVQCDANGSIIKLNRRKLTERADFLDCFRYFVNAILAFGYVTPETGYIVDVKHNATGKVQTFEAISDEAGLISISGLKVDPLQGYTISLRDCTNFTICETEYTCISFAVANTNYEPEGVTNLLDCTEC